MSTTQKLFQWCLVFTVVCLSVFGTAAQPAQSYRATGAYVDPALNSNIGTKRSVIVTAADSMSASRAVQAAGGQVTSDLWLVDSVAAVIAQENIALLGRQPGVSAVIDNKPVSLSGKPAPSKPQQNPDSSINLATSQTTTQEISTKPVATNETTTGWVTSYRYPVPWDGTPDVQATSSRRTWKLAYPAIVDTGADQVANIDGKGITVAVVDSGVYFDPIISSELIQVTTRQFLGQADFVDSQCPTRLNNVKTELHAFQYAGYCFTDTMNSKDLYGHGTHVAGIIWNNLLDHTTGRPMGIAPGANILSVRVLGADGSGSYETVIRGIQYVLETRSAFNTRVINLSLSAQQTVPYFVDPLDRAVEQAWAAGIVVVAAAGNEGPLAQTITVPGNDPYVVTVGAVDGRRTAGYWADDLVPAWNSTGPTLDGFVKPDLVAPGTEIVSFMHNDAKNLANSPYLVRTHPDYSLTTSLFRMSGTSMATAVTSGAVALMLEAHPELTPAQVKYRLMATTHPIQGDEPVNIFQSGAGRLWIPDAVNLPVSEAIANQPMNISEDLAYGWGYMNESGSPVVVPELLAHHYLGSVSRLASADGKYNLYAAPDGTGGIFLLGITNLLGQWLQPMDIPEGVSWSSDLVWSGGRMVWSGGRMVWSGGEIGWQSPSLFETAGRMVWSGGRMIWSGSVVTDSVGQVFWSEDGLVISEGRMTWSGMVTLGVASGINATRWVQ